MTTPPLPNDDELDVKLNNPLSSFDNIPALTVTDLPSLESTEYFNRPLTEVESPIEPLEIHAQIPLTMFEIPPVILDLSSLVDFFHPPPTKI